MPARKTGGFRRVLENDLGFGQMFFSGRSTKSGRTPSKLRNHFFRGISSPAARPDLRDSKSLSSAKLLAFRQTGCNHKLRIRGLGRLPVAALLTPASLRKIPESGLDFQGIACGSGQRFVHICQQGDRRAPSHWPLLHQRIRPKPGPLSVLLRKAPAPTLSAKNLGLQARCSQLLGQDGRCDQIHTSPRFP